VTTAERTRASLVEDAQAYIAGDRRRALASGAAMADRVYGSAIFADISGFTPLTEALAKELGAQRGAEELGAILNVVYDAVLGELHRHGGSVLYFSGDAVTCWLDGDKGGLGVSCGLAMQRAMEGVATVTTPGGRTVRLGMKVAVAAGPARRFVVGDPAIQLIDVLAGALMDRLASAEHVAERGEVVVDAPTLELLGEDLELALVRGHGPQKVGVVAALRGRAPLLPTPLPYPRLPRDVVRPWLLPAVYERMRTGRGEFLSELRPAVPMFVRFGGINYDEDPEAHLLLDRFIVQAQRVIDGYGGNLLQLTIGDKGAYVHAVFGSPLAHEDDAARACAAALDVLDLEAVTAISGLQIGISTGRVRSGAYGHSHRRAFTCLGDPVNLSARLMSAAPSGQVFVSAQVARDASSSFSFEELPDLTVKGKSAQVAVRRLLGRIGPVLYRQRRVARPLIGRSEELSRLLGLAELARAGTGQVVALVAEAGMGKSRLVEEVLGLLCEQGMPVFSGEATSVGSVTSYLAWQPVWAALFALTGDGDLQAELEHALTELDASLVPRLPLLGPALGLTIEDNELTRSFDAKLRKSSLESLLVRYLTRRASGKPLVLVLEDCHWLDPLSVDLLEVLARAIAALPVLVVLTYRPGSFKAPPLPHTTLVQLDRLDALSCRQLVVSRLAELYGPEMVPSEALMRTLTERAEGNPFYLEELVNYLHSQGSDLSEDGAEAPVELPASLAALVLSRIDALAEPPRRVLKVASVVGREFGLPALMGAHPRLGTPRHVTGHLRRLCGHDLLMHEEPAVAIYTFKHAVIHEVAYDSLPYALRARLHERVGLWLELNQPQALDLLAHHFWRSAEDVKKKEYLLQAGEAAQARYANEAAVDYFRRAVPLLSGTPRVEVLMKLGAVLELRGDWGEAEAVFSEALEHASMLGDSLLAARARAARADPLRRRGQFDEAAAELGSAGQTFEAMGDTVGLGRVAHTLGNIASYRGDLDLASAHWGRSLRIRTALGDGPGQASMLSNLAVVAGWQEDYERAQALNMQALELRTALGDRWGIAMSENNIGQIACLQHDYGAARSHLEQGLRTALEVGDLWLIGLVHHSLGNTQRDLGDSTAARHNYAEALRRYSLIGSKWDLSTLFEDVAIQELDAEPRAALRLIGAGEAVRQELGSPRSSAQQAELDEKLSGARARLGEDAERELAAGHGLSPAQAQDLALEVCEKDR
jgi:class 3 adenylate cyclase/tetratricopeptide (TPR) repeat protein